MAVNWKGSKMIAVLTVILLASSVAGYKFYLRHSSPEVRPVIDERPPPPENERQYVQSLNKKFPKGTDIGSLKSQIQEEGFTESKSCHHSSAPFDDRTHKVACFNKGFRRSKTSTLFSLDFFAIYDDNNKVVYTEVIGTDVY